MLLASDSPLLQHYLKIFGHEVSAEVKVEEPSELDTRAVHFLEVGTDKLSVKYCGDARHEDDVGSIQSSVPIPGNLLIYYYEVKVVSQGDRGRIAVGFADRKFRQGSHPGCELSSYGYHGEDGSKHQNGDGGNDYGPTFGTHDVVGAGINVGRGEIFFTRNGRNLGVAFEGMKSKFYPTVGLHSPNEHVRINFGAQPFVFDIQGLIAEERQKYRRSISQTEVASGVSHEIVRDYLTYFGYGRTLAAFDVAAGYAPSGEDVQETSGKNHTSENWARRLGNGSARAPAAGYCSHQSHGLEFRQEVRALVMCGDIDGAMKAINHTCPGILGQNTHYPDAPFFLRCQKYIELIRAGEVGTAMSFAQTAFAPFRGNSTRHDAVLSEIFALVAYEDPQRSLLAHLLGSEHREVIADIINVVIISDARGSLGSESSKCLLERLLAQLSSVHDTLIECNEGFGERFNLDTVLQLNMGAQA